MPAEVLGNLLGRSVDICSYLLKNDERGCRPGVLGFVQLALAGRGGIGAPALGIFGFSSYMLEKPCACMLGPMDISARFIKQMEVLYLHLLHDSQPGTEAVSQLGG